MRNTLHMMRLDLITIKPYRKILWVFLVLTTALSAINKGPTQPIFFLSFYLIIMQTYPFALEEKNGLSMLYGSLSINRTTVVRSRYLLVTIGFFVCIAVSFILYTLLTVFLKLTMTNLEFLISACIMFVLYALVLSLQIPLYFRYGYSKAKLMIYIPLLCVAILPFIGKYFLRDTALYSSLSRFFSTLTAQPPLLTILSLLAGLLLLSVSYCVSRTIYLKKELA